MTGFKTLLLWFFTILAILRMNPGHIGHAAVADFQSVPIKDLCVDVAAREVFVNQVQELPSNVSFHMATERWVEPDDLAIALLPASLRFELQ